jgi:GT2 family glycosyltransferase
MPVRLSVVIPTRSRVASLAALLERLTPGGQGLHDGAFEVIVMDDSGNGEASGRLHHKFPHVRFANGPRRGPAANRNAGARLASGEWLVFVDDDCVPCNGWLRSLVDASEAKALDVIEGKIVVPDKRASLLRRDVENLNGGCFWSANLAVRREYFERLGGFDEDFPEAGGEDMELAHRFRSTGARTIFCAAAVVYHPSHVMTWRELWSFAFRIRWHLLFRLKTRQALPADAPAWRALASLIWIETLTLLRTTRQNLRGLHTQNVSPRLARTLFNWTLFPVLLPYMVYWDRRFRRITRTRQRAAARTATPRMAGPA